MPYRKLLPTVRLASHRGFRDEAVLQLCPLTLLYGKNQAGKSTLLRLLPFLGDSLASTRGPLDMTSPALRGATFKELGWLGPGYEATQRFGFSVGESSKLQLDIADEGKGPFVNRVAVLLDESTVFDARWAGVDVYAGTCEGAAWEGPLGFKSLLPPSLPGIAGTDLDKIHRSLEIFTQAQWFQANRLAREGESAQRPCRCCAPDGADLAVLLQSSPQVVELASRWLSDEVGMGALRIGRDGRGRPVFELRPQSNWEHLPVALAGEGLRSLLPILVSMCWADARDKDAPSMLAIEEPEAHLHPKLQVALLDRLVESVRNGLPVVVETHSAYIRLAMQRAVLKGLLDPTQVALYWVEQSHDGASCLRRVDIHQDATLAGWPPGVFEEEQSLAREIFDERWAQEQKVEETQS